MKKLVFIFCIMLSFLSEAQKKQVKLQVSQYIPYCGGARPPKEMEDAAKLPQPYANTTLIYKNAKGKVDSVRTNDSGLVVLNLPYGTYRFYEAWRHYKSLPDLALKKNYDQACMKKEWAKSLITIAVSKTYDGKIRKADIYIKCTHQQPCILRIQLPE